MRILILMLISLTVQARTLVVGDSLTVAMFSMGAFTSEYVSLASGGATSEFAANNLEGAIRFLNGPDFFGPQINKVVVILGMNDYLIGTSISDFAYNYRLLLSYIPDTANLYCIGLTPSTEEKFPPMIFYALWQERICEESGGTYLSPYYLGLENYLTDHVHLNPEGYRILARFIMYETDYKWN